MTARLELAKAIGNRMNEWGENPLTPSYWEDLLDDLPADVLARYAIERGGLEQVAWRAGLRMGEYGYMTYYSGEAGHADHTRIYRVVES